MISPEDLDFKLTQCTRCGTCLKACPLYAETQEEAYTARAKVQLTKAMARGRLPFTKHLGDMSFMCLACKSCQVACPNKVDGAEYALHLREMKVGQFGQPAIKSLLFRQVLPSTGLLGLGGGVGGLAQRVGLDRWFLSRQGLEDYVPSIPSASLTRRLKLRPRRRVAGGKARVAYFYGCATNLVFPDAGMATVSVLERSGFAVTVPDQVCCGLPAYGHGDVQAAKAMARKNMESFARQGFDYIVADCASCSSMLKDYGHLLGTDEAKAFSAKVRDATQFVAKEGMNQDLVRGESLTVTYHDPCHLKRWQGVAAEPRAIIKSIPGVTLKEMKEPDRCCGAAGTFALTNPELSEAIGRKKADMIVATGAGAVVTACPGCRIQIAYNLRKVGHPLPVLSPMELLHRAYENRDADNVGSRNNA